MRGGWVGGGAREVGKKIGEQFLTVFIRISPLEGNQG